MPNEIYHRSNWGNANAEGFGDVYFDAAATNKLYNHSDYYENSDGTDKILKDLSNKASIVLTPTAYSDGSLNTVIPPYQVLPTELVTNGTFDTDSDWTKGSGWSISSGTANANSASSSYFYQTINELAVGKTYSITYTITSYTSGSVVTGIGDLLGNRGTTRNAIGTYTDIITFSSNTTNDYFGFFATSSFTGSIDNVSVKEIQEADFDFSRGSSATRVNEKGLIEDVASGIPRIDYTSGFGSLLLEPQRTNLITYSEDLTQWNASSGIQLTSSQLGVGNSTDAWKIQRSLAYDNIRSIVSFTSTSTVSVYAKKGSYNFLRIAISAIPEQCYFDLENGIIGTTSNLISSDIKYINNGWYRCSMTFNNSSGTGVYIQPVETDGGIGNSGTGHIFVQYPQVEAGSYPTSYIVSNSGSTTTRSADVANNSGNADLFNDSEGVLYAEIAALANDSTNRKIAIGTSSNRIIFGYKNSSNQIRVEVISSGSAVFDNSQTIDDVTTFSKFAIKYKQNDFALWVNGEEVATDTSGNTPIGLSELAFDDGGSNDFYGKTKELAVFKEALTDAELESLTSWVSFTEMATDLEYTLE